VAADRIRGLLQEQRLLLGLMPSRRLHCSVAASSGTPGHPQRQELAVHAHDEDAGDLDRQIPSSGSWALLEMEGPLHGVCVDLAPGHGKLLLWSLLPSVSTHRFHLALAPPELD
jgi:hypothetical protein